MHCENEFNAVLLFLYFSDEIDDYSTLAALGCLNYTFEAEQPRDISSNSASYIVQFIRYGHYCNW